MEIHNKKRKIISFIIIILALILLTVGIKKEEFKTYFSKARNICTQCIGIG